MAGRGTRTEIDCHGPARDRIVHSVCTGLTIQIVIAGRTPQPVVKVGAEQTLDVAEPVAQTITQRTCRAVEANFNARGGTAIVSGITCTALAVHNVGTSATNQGVIVSAAEQRVIA